MILLAGGTGTLGRLVLPRLTAGGMKVRLVTREPDRARGLAGASCEIARADVREVNGLAAAMRGVRTVVSVMSGYGPNIGGDPRSVDGAGNCNLIRAAESAGVEHFVLVSVQGAGPRHPMELMRMKFMAEQQLKASRLAWTIIRPTAFIETWAQIAGKGIVFGRGDNPINFVSACDVAEVVERAVTDRALRGVELEVGGPEDLTLRQFAANFAAGHLRIPRPAMRLMSVLARPINPSMARLAHSAVVMDTFDLKLDRSGNNNHPVIVGATSVAAVAREVGQRVGDPPPKAPPRIVSR